MQGFDFAALLDACIYLVPLLALIVSISTFKSASRERHERTAADAAELKADIHMLSINVEELKTRVESASEGYHRNATRLTKLEEQAKTLWNKLEDLERRIGYAD